MEYKILIKEDEIINRSKELAKEIKEHFNNEPIVMICILKGSIMFFCELSKHLKDIEAEFEFMICSSYEGTKTTGIVRIDKDIDRSIEGKNVLIVEDIIDTGYTLNYVTKLLKDRLPKKLSICTMLDKPQRRMVDVDVDFVGFEIEDKFVIGYGLDYDQKYRQLPYVAYVE